jgi:hypothetical protein
MIDAVGEFVGGRSILRDAAPVPPLPEEGQVPLKPEPIGPVPVGTARVARATFPKGTTYTRMGDELGVV